MADPIRGNNPSIDYRFPPETEKTKEAPESGKTGAAAKIQQFRQRQITERQDSGSQEERLPDPIPIAPSTDAITDEIGNLQGRPSIDDVMAGSLQPNVEHPEVLHPSQFQGLLDDAAEAFDSLRGGKDASAPLHQGAYETLEDERALQRMFFANRHALHQG